MLTELMQYAEGSPLLLAALVAAGAVLAVIERVFALSGPITKLVGWWQGREMAQLRREATLRAEKRRIQQEDESAIIATLRAEVDYLKGEVARLRVDTAPLRAARNTPRVPYARR